MKYQLVPPHDHRRNIYEKAIQFFKDHFVLVLCGIDKNLSLATVVSYPSPSGEPTKPATKVKGGADNISLCTYVWAT